jgi:quercetin dioxygenase-like cupin family protein
MSEPQREPQVVYLDRTETVKLSPLSYYQPIIGDAEGTTPIRTGIQTAAPGYAAPVHSHPYLEILDGVAEACVDGQEDKKVVLRRGGTIALPPGVPHAFRVVGDETLRLLGTHCSSRRIVDSQDGGVTDERGYRVMNS